MRTGVDLIAEERESQIIEKGYSLQSDLNYENNELVRAAVIYAKPNHYRPFYNDGSKTPIGWPFKDEHWKPSPENRVKELQKAGALIAAEIDRLLNLQK